MDNSVANILLSELNQIKFILAGILVFLLLVAAAVVVLAVIAGRRSSNKKAPKDLQENGRELLDKGELDRLIDLCNETLKHYPSHSYAHWYLGVAYYRKKDWRKSMNELEFVYNNEPGWREEHIDPYLDDVRKKVKSFKPEIV